MKDRIRQIMESQHMTQQVFADYIGTTPATLSGIFNDRTRPTINIVENIKKKFPDISLDWLMFGLGDMYKQIPAVEPDLFDGEATSSSASSAENTPLTSSSSSLHFQQAPAVAGQSQQNVRLSAAHLDSVKMTLKETLQEELKIFDKRKRHVIEIRVYYDDGSYESFLPAPVK